MQEIAEEITQELLAGHPIILKVEPLQSDNLLGHYRTLSDLVQECLEVHEFPSECLSRKLTEFWLVALPEMGQVVYGWSAPLPWLLATNYELMERAIEATMQVAELHLNDVDVREIETVLRQRTRIQVLKSTSLSHLTDTLHTYITHPQCLRITIKDILSDTDPIIHVTLFNLKEPSDAREQPALYY